MNEQNKVLPSHDNSSCHKVAHFFFFNEAILESHIFGYSWKLDLS